jgi:hypothetical protein
MPASPKHFVAVVLALAATAAPGAVVTAAASEPVVAQSAANDTSPPLGAIPDTRTPTGFAGSHPPGQLPRPARPPHFLGPPVHPG